jgi:very-short-patch-repair endonuclease
VQKSQTLPPELAGTAFLTSDPIAVAIGESRLRAPDVLSPHRGVRAVALNLETVAGRCAAYKVRMPSWQFFSHLTAAQLYGIPLPLELSESRALHVSVQNEYDRPRVKGVTGHRLKIDDAGVWQVDGFVVADPITTWCQLATVLRVDDLIAAGDFIVSGAVLDGGRSLPLATIEELRRGKARFARRRGAKRIAEAVDYVRTEVDSRPESLLRMLLVRAELDEPHVNVPLFDRFGTRIGRPDLLYPNARLAIEYEGDIHRIDKERFRRDIARREQFEDAGIRVIRVTSDDLFGEPDALIARVRRQLKQRTVLPVSGESLTPVSDRGNDNSPFERTGAGAKR